MADETVLRVWPLGDHCSIHFLDRDTLGRERGALIRRSKRQYRRTLFLKPHCHSARAEIWHQSLERKQTASGDNVCFHLREASPPIQAPMSLEDFFKK
jgi:hypothetical protein